MSSVRSFGQDRAPLRPLLLLVLGERIHSNIAVPFFLFRKKGEEIFFILSIQKEKKYLQGILIF